MRDFMSFKADEYPLERVLSLKGDRHVIVIFSTFGEREADLIHHKISLLRRTTGDLVDRIYLSHRRAGDDRERTEEMAIAADPSVEIILSRDTDVPDMGDERGKGADMRRALHHVRMTRADWDPGNTVVVFLDADVVTEFFGPHFVLALAGPVLQGYDFVKGAFWRQMGRVKKFVAQPLFSLVSHPKLADLARFAYPLAGEVAGTMDFFSRVTFWQMYGVETGMLVDACMGDWRVAEANLGLYDHEHHADPGIQKMSFGVMRTFLLKLEEYGILSLGTGASVSDTLSVSMIDGEGNRMAMEHDLRERTYRPLCELWRD